MPGKKIEHETIDGIENKCCSHCKVWLPLDEFHNDKNSWDGKRCYCKKCDIARMQNCKHEGCTRKAVSGYEYCGTHNPNTCKFEDCIRKTSKIGRDFCHIHDTERHCEFEGCTNLKRKNGFCTKHGEKNYCKHDGCKNIQILNGYCKTHGPKKYCKYDGCNKIESKRGYCEEHDCAGNISKCAVLLLKDANARDKLKDRTNNLTKKAIIDMYNESNKCHWCKHELKLCKRGKFDLDKISLDRIDNNKGYDIENINLSCVFCNFARGACKPKLWKKIMKVLRGKKHTINFEKYAPRREVGNFLNVMSGPNNLTTKWLLEQLQKNDFKCALTQLPIYITKKHSFPLNFSVDRVDNKKGHLQDNCIVTCRLVNFGKNKIPQDEFKAWFSNRFPKMKINKIIYPKDYKKDFLSSRKYFKL